MRTSPPGYCTHLPGPGSYPRGWGPGRRLACARRQWGGSQRGAPRSLGRRAERSGGQGSRLLPQGRATLGRQTQDKIKRKHHKAETGYAARGPGTRRRERNRPGGGAHQGAPAVPFRCIDGQAAGARSGLVQRVSHLVIHYRGDLSGPRAALSPSQAFVIPTWVLVSVGV